MATWIVMTSAAKVHGRRRQFGTYRRVCLVQLTQDYTARGQLPKMISEHARGVLKVIDMGSHSVGKTERCAYAKAVKEAERRVLGLNTAAPEAEGELLMSFGSA